MTAAFAYSTGRSKASSSPAIPGENDNSAHVKMVNSDYSLSHVNTCHDQIILFSAHVNNEVGFSNLLRF